jgi:hypothetical protein
MTPHPKYSDGAKDPEQAALAQAVCSASVARELIVNRVNPWEVVGNVTCHDGEWRAIVTLTPSGPMTLMRFRISQWEMPNAPDQRPPK